MQTRSPQQLNALCADQNFDLKQEHCEQREWLSSEKLFGPTAFCSWTRRP